MKIPLPRRRVGVSPFHRASEIPEPTATVLKPTRDALEYLFAGNNPAAWGICGIIKLMPYILEHLSSLRQEITDLRNMNARYTGKGSDHQIDQSAVEMRANRLAEIKKELSQMLNRPEDPKVWWEKGGRRNRVA